MGFRPRRASSVADPLDTANALPGIETSTAKVGGSGFCALQPFEVMLLAWFGKKAFRPRSGRRDIRSMYFETVALRYGPIDD